jgi:type I restriction enzyme R subunit
MLPEELAREKIDKQLNRAGWDIVLRDEYVPNTTSAVKGALMKKRNPAKKVSRHSIC